MSFRLFGVNVEIGVFFWITAVFLGYPILQSPTEPKGDILIWVAVVLVSILVHEYSHAFAIMRHHVEPQIALHGMGGSTSYRAVLPLRRIDLILISLAGPFAGFLLAGLIYVLARLTPLGEHLPRTGALAVEMLLEVNIFWGVFNLLPVLPMDGGHVLEQALGPKRQRLSAGISLAVSAAACIFALLQHDYWLLLLFGMSASRSYQTFSSARAAVPRPSSGPPVSAPDALPAELAALLQSARAALAGEDLKRARELAEQVVEQSTAPRATLQGLEIITWVHLLDGRTEEAAQTLAQARRFAEPDPALSGAVFLARGDTKEARRLLEAARARGDDRKEVVGPLIRILLEGGETARAAAVAFDIVDSLSDEDARRMASLAYEGGVYEWSGRLHESMFARRALAEDAYEAARAFAKAGQPEHALELLRKAVDAGFSDRARAWSDAALEALRALPPFESFLPRP